METNETDSEVAYDYDAQKWVEGAEAVALLARQRAEEEELVNGPRGAEYLAFIAKKGGR